MSHNEDLFLKKKIFFPSGPDGLNFVPAGSLSSFYDSMNNDSEIIGKTYLSSNFTEEEAQISYQIIAYESIMQSAMVSKETQTETIENGSQEKIKIQELQKNIAKISLDCNSYAKQNEELRKELIAVSQSQDSEKVSALKEEIKRLKSKIHVHENMVEKLIVISEEICDENNENHRKSSKIDFHAYNYLISKLEIIRSRMKRYVSKTKQLELDKISITELLNFYVSAAKLMETQKVSKNFTTSNTPDIMNPAFSSRKSSVLMENSSNTLRNTPFEDENFSKKPLSSGSDASEPKEMNYPNTLTNLKGISKLGKDPNVIKKNKNGTSQSISPILPKPRKTSKKNPSLKENCKIPNVKIIKSCADDCKKMNRNRCKS